MKKFLFAIGLVVFTGLIVGFSVLNYSEKKFADENILLGMLYQQRAAEYEALCLQSYHIAQMQAEHAWDISKDRSHLAIVTDLDETALNNTGGEAYDYQHDIPYSFGELTLWQVHGKAEAVPGAVDFFNWAVAKGFHVYYVSNRPNSTQVIESTRVQMKNLGFPLAQTAADDKYFLFAPKGISSKQPRRDSIANKLGDKIVVLLGDNLADLSGDFDKTSDKKYLPDTTRWNIAYKLKKMWGNKYVVFPNAYYGDWESTFYQSYEPHPGDTVTRAQKYAIRDSLLKTYNFRH